MLVFKVYQRVQYGPLGRDNQWIHRLLCVGGLIALDEIDAVAQAKRMGFVAPIVEPAS